MKLFGKKNKKNKSNSLKQPNNIVELIDMCKTSSDFMHYEHSIKKQTIWLSFYKSLVDTEILHKDILENLQEYKHYSLEELKESIPVEKVLTTKDVEQMQNRMLRGYILLRLDEYDQKGLLINAPLKKTRNVSVPEVEFSVIGPKEAFLESIDTNLNLVRNRLPIPELMVKELKVGKLTKSKVAVLYIDGVANEENVNTVIQRIKEIDIDHLVDSSYITQIISDNPKSPFPQLLDTERPDRASAVLTEGKIVIMAAGSPHALIAPANLTEFFSSFEDYFLNPVIASAFRIIRFFSVVFSILVTPIYVATLTYHYELIPKDLMGTLITSREVVPLPPILEAIFLELTIELLREAGARLPTKVGQTIGIVGGIVIGTASVEAGLTSNVLLIIIALAALASFTTPVYQMGNTIRLIRFPFIFVAYLFGMLGVVLSFCYLIVHLLRLTSLGRPFFEPIYPPRLKDMKDSIIRFPFSRNTQRPVQLQTEQTERYSKRDATKKKDIDE
ncbi:GerA spore germination protein [Salinibacillus kushneri]|uniref:GerA spore germination protein n=1 Tax=Salinibacillus kushneri TaxID=237682 RepID=A0A1I0IPP8_9BACI|nr:spore germination protein [Salinibacillus kushneri]SET99151.1 GerA spore germination protein [Salinibacillus kushneri]